MKGIFVGIAGGSAQRCLGIVRDAVKKAERPGRLAFGVCPEENADPASFFQAAGPAACRLMTGEGLALKDAWQTVYGLYGGQAYALQVTPETVFLEYWDRSLLTALHEAAAERPLLTSFLMPDHIPRAVAVMGFAPEGCIQTAPGMKVLRALLPPRTFFLCPDFVFGAGEWMRRAREDDWDGTGVIPLTANACANGFTAFVPHVPTMGRVAATSCIREHVPAGDWGINLPELEKAAGVCFEKREADAKARLGIYTSNGRYPVQLPLMDGLCQFIRRRREHPISRVMLATALGRHKPSLPMDAHLTLFSNLSELKRLSLCCYCPPEQAKVLQQYLPNTYARQEEEGENLSYGSEESFLKNKPYFIAEAARHFPSHTHYGWIDMDYVKHPVYPNAVFVWDEMTDHRIHMAQVDGQVDTGLLIVPRGKVEWLLATAAVLNPDPALGYGDVGLFQCLKDTYPDEFALHPMEKRHMLLSLCQPMIHGGMLYDA